MDNADFGVMLNNAGRYDPVTGRMAQADTVVPGGGQGLDRYSSGEIATLAAPNLATKAISAGIFTADGEARDAGWTLRNMDSVFVHYPNLPP